ncbi:class I adenylate-forming enzyme family protein [Polaromonas sp.]|uniref:AMP-binding protein n=1 Tax=Polaromonas sp. TaxID=1869339 RepID=UPI0013BCFC27|nr:class I adenylate-forming enzyme family protein [Polaromonas sp.]NDP64855.1 acyl--CoA ligase [Polaromonas sp.]
MNITEPIWRHCHSQPDSTALIADGQHTSYGELMEKVWVVSTRLRRAGIRQDDRVSVGLEFPAALIVVVLALARLGAVISPFRNSWPPARKRLLLLRHEVQFLIHEPSAGWYGEALPGFCNLEAGLLLAPRMATETLQTPDMACNVDDAYWWLGLSASATGALRSVGKTHRRDMLSVALSRYARTATPLRVLVYGDVTGLGGSMLRCLSAGGTLILTASTDPRHFFDVVETDRPTQLVTSTATAAWLVANGSQHLTDSRQRCASITSVVLMGNVVPTMLMEKIQQHVCRQVEIYYGASEVGLIASLDQDSYHAHPGVHGKLLPWVKAEAVSANDRPLEAGQTGLLRLKTPVMAEKYLNDPQASLSSFREGWFYPGYAGSVDAQGYLRLAGGAGRLPTHHSAQADGFQTLSAGRPSFLTTA